MPILTAFAVAFATLVQPALADWTFDKNGEPTHYKGIPIPPMQTVEQARAATEKRLAAIKAEEAKQAAVAAELATRNPLPDTAPQELFFTGKPYLEETGHYLFLFRHYDPELARWTTADPSGFPDGANNLIYSTRPLIEFDPTGEALYDYTTVTDVPGLSVMGTYSSNWVFDNFQFQVSSAGKCFVASINSLGNSHLIGTIKMNDSLTSPQRHETLVHEYDHHAVDQVIFYSLFGAYETLLTGYSTPRYRSAQQAAAAINSVVNDLVNQINQAFVNLSNTWQNSPRHNAHAGVHGESGHWIDAAYLTKVTAAANSIANSFTLNAPSSTCE